MAFLQGERGGLLSELERMRRQLEDLAEGFVSEASQERDFPLVNIWTSADHLTVRAELPGVNPLELEVAASSSSLTISGKREENSPEGTHYYRREREFGSFSRIIPLPERVDPEGVKADYQEGMLCIFLPKAKEVLPRNIKIKTKG